MSDTKHKNLAIFVPHQGCPNQCSFCDQRSISGQQTPPLPWEVQQLCERYLPLADTQGNWEIAFFGGSFTAIDPAYRVALLEVAHAFIKQGRATGIRVSTRPDAISTPILTQLKSYGVTAIELGAQSMQEQVLACNLRGHTTQAVYDASLKIKDMGFSLGLQMMTGLYGQQDYWKAALDTAQQFITIKPDTVRIYPTLVLKDTLLEEKYKMGSYQPPSLEATVEICAALLTLFEQANIKVIKMGLHADQGMEQKLVAGPYHPAFKELCLSWQCLEKIKDKLTSIATKKIIIKVPPQELSQWKGQKNSNAKQLEKMGYTAQFKPEPALLPQDFIIEFTNEQGENKCI